MEFTAKCKRCGKYNNVAIKTDWLTDKPKCVQCGWLLTPSQEAEIKPPAFDIPDIVLVLGGIVLGPAGLFASLFLGMSKDKFMKGKAKVAAAWAFIGCVLYLLLFMYVPPAKNLMMEIYYKILAFGGR
ncbi:MAG: hypothetical protein HY318_18285 [Armatimonadetes bacterium]|nr:hypothetical protein [Armatimonadota bacterium]